MELFSKIEENETLELTLKGAITGYEDYSEVKHFVKSKIHAHGGANLCFYFVGGHSVDTRVMGLVLKLREIDRLNINIVVSSSKLYEYLMLADFHKFFDIKIKEYR